MAGVKENFIPYTAPVYEDDEMIKRSKEFYEFLNTRRSVRTYSDKDIPREVIENIVKSAGTAPSGAHKQPWTFCIIRNADLKKKVRELAEEEERKNYGGRMSDRWLKDLEPFGTNEVKEFIEVAPWVIIVFKRSYDFDEEGNKTQNYYVNESVGIASGMLITAIHNAGLVTLTHTPSPMNFISEALKRPDNEKPFLLLPIGYPVKDCTVPNLSRKSLDDIAIFYE
ncbi:nitroreductase family protein [Paracrocinitomix mangrovi]|uniref:nitroreductase family protein n=1 Tax=Paracrocinitomix mangrovi TaxID=2862509 RepID=UPI001C8D826B|nr:nitroreductase family protein [Paracrocinitomix mangrovi]UKN00643.1 nitroreductase family protein [Paracrocinitomix mangrovi]